MVTILVLAAVAVGAVVLIPGVRAANDRRDTSWIDAILKGVVIFVVISLVMVFLPSYVLQHEEVTKLDRTVQDLLGSGVWGAGFVGSLWLLFWAHGRGRV